MKLSTVMVVNAVVNVIFGIALVVVPGALAGLLGLMAMEPLTEQLFGAELIGFAVLNWFARNMVDGDAAGPIILANLVSNAIGFIVIVILQLSGLTLGGLGRLVAVVPLLFTLAFGYFLFADRGRALSGLR